MQNRLVVNVSKFNITEYSSWTLLFPELENVTFLNLDGKVQDENQFVNLINKNINFLRRTKSTVLDYHFIFFFPDESCKDVNLGQVDFEGFNFRIELVYFDKKEPKINNLQNYERYSIAIDNKKDRAGVWNYQKYSYVLFDTVKQLITNSKIEVGESNNYNLTAAEEGKNLTLIKVNTFELGDLVANYKYFLEEEESKLEAKESQEKVDVYNYEEIDKLDFAKLKNEYRFLSQEGMDEQSEVPNRDELKNKPDELSEVRVLYSNVKKHLEKIRGLKSKKEGLFTLSNVELSDENRKEIEFKYDKRSNTAEINSKILEYRKELNKEESQTQDLLLPKVTDIELKNLEIFYDNTVGVVENYNSRKRTTKTIKYLCIFFTLTFFTSAIPLVFSFSVITLLYSLLGCLSISSLALLISAQLQSRKIKKFNNDKIHEFKQYLDKIKTAKSINFEVIKRILNKRKALVENINILKRMLKDRQEKREIDTLNADKIDTLLKMKDVSEVTAIKTSIDDKHLSTTELLKEMKNG